MSSLSVLAASQWNDQNLIESIISSFFIIDYGFITKVNPDKTINVTHAKLLKSYTGESFPETDTTNVEVLTLAGKGFSINFDYEKGDKVLLLGLKDYVESVDDVTQATETKAYLHYSRETIKALPLCVFNSDAKVKIEVESGTLKVTTKENIELNGNDKSFVTYKELNDALQDIWSAIKTHTHAVSTTGSASAQTGTASASTDLASKSLDISKSETETVKTGG